MLLLACLPSAADEAELRQAAIDDRTGAIIQKDQTIYVLALALPGERYRDLAIRATGDGSNEHMLREYNRDPAPVPGKRYLIPFQYALPELQLKAARALFPEDRYEAGRYVHVVSAGTGVTQGENLWTIASWFTGDGENFRRLMKRNKLDQTRLEKGQRVLIPDDLLSPAFRPVQPTRIENPAELAFETVDGKAYGVYRLKKGEALYSGVVIRFCGRIDADEVNELAAGIARLNNIADVRNIKADQPIRIPVALLSPEYRPSTDPERVAYETSRQAPLRFQRRFSASNLEGVRVILDSGHGGVDPGARSGKAAEDEHVYDVLCRAKDVVEKKSKAKVIPLIKDRVTGFAPRGSGLLPMDRNEILLTTPAYGLSSTRAGVNLRWCLANYHFDRLRKEGVPEGKVVFVSFHADSRHPIVQGAMVYVAGEEHVSESCEVTSPVYTARKEVREHPVAYFPKVRRVESEGLSTSLASALVRALEQAGLPVQKPGPIRPFVFRKNKAWVPGVLKYNEVPTKVLIEVCNMNNVEDVSRLADASYRQRLAEAFLAALIAYFSPEQEAGT